MNNIKKQTFWQLSLGLFTLVFLLNTTYAAETPDEQNKASEPVMKSNVKQNEIIKMDRIVAIVDQVVITEKELADRIKTVTTQLEKQGTELPPQAILEKQILERMITDRLQLQFAGQTGLRVDDNQVDKTIERIAAQNKLDLPTFKKALSDDGISFRKFREDIRNEILLARLREREVENRINVTESEIDNFLTTQAARQD
ncbi:MAG: Chaperone SurA, partial [Pseudomonadota bacterium]